MSTFKCLQCKRSINSTPTTSLLRPSRPFAPLPTPVPQQVPPVTQEQLERTARLGHSLDRISILPPASRAAEVNKTEQASVIATMQQASSMSVSAPSPEAIPTEEHANSGHIPRFGYSFATIPLFPTVQRKAVLPSPLQEESQLGPHIQAARSSGHPLDKQAQQRLEQGLGADLSRVRVHTDSEADHLSRSINAVAFTTGPDIFFRSGTYHPSSLQGLRLLAHEATHVVQQMAGLVTGVHTAHDVSISDPKDHFEQAADQAAGQFMGTSASPSNIFIQRVTVPSTHEAKDAKKYVRHKAYAEKPRQSEGQQERLGKCGACGRKEPFSRLQVDHVVPENFLRKLLQLYHQDKALGAEIAKVLRLDWGERTEIDVSKVQHIESWREKFAAYEFSDPVEFEGKLYEVKQDTENLWLLCQDCNGKLGKTDKLLEEDYDALNDWYKKLKKNSPKKTLAQHYLADWISSGHFWVPEKAVRQIDVPNSPGYDRPKEVAL